MREEERETYLSSLTDEIKANLKYHWPFWARPNQLPPTEEENWTTWLLMAGRGFGKSRCGAEWVREMALKHPGCRIALVAETAADARRVMVEGESGILAISPPDFFPDYSPANRMLTWPNGSTAYTYNATQPDQLRGPQHHFAWSDELAKWQLMQDSWDQLQFGLRLGKNPKQVVTTTPRPLTLIRKLVNDPTTFVTYGSTEDNKDNLAAPFLKTIYDKYGGTRLGRQELNGEILEDIPGALWTRDSIDRNRRPEIPTELQRIVVAVDPSASSNEGSDETGIVCVGIARDEDGYNRGYVLADRSLRGSPDEWAKAAVALYREFEADRIVAEKNQGGEMVEAVIRAVDRNVPVSLVHATRGKLVRAEPISALYEQNRVHHIGHFDTLEDQMCTFAADFDRKDGSPDRMDALVWGLAFLFERMTGRRRSKQLTESSEEYKLKDVTATQNNVYRGESDTSWMGI